MLHEIERGINAYIATPTEPGPGVVVIQEWWGLVGHIRDVADRFAQEGFCALAPDFYGGKTTSEPDEAGSLMMALQVEHAARVVQGAVGALTALPQCLPGKVGAVGFCMGGQLSLYAACIDSRIGACVDFYGIHPNVSPPLERLGGPVLGHFAEHDDYATPESVAALAAALDGAGKAHEFHTYPGTHHAFFNDGRPEVYDPAASALAWERTLAFLRANLPG
jgi:carboxymethylenebutenolidase